MNLINGRFILKDTNYFLLPGNPHMLHLATISSGLREFVAMLDRTSQKVYIEEVVLETKDTQKDVWANFKFVEDDSLAGDLAAFCEEKKVIDMKRLSQALAEQGRVQWLTKGQKPGSRG